MNEEFSIFYLLHDLMPLISWLGTVSLYFCVFAIIYDDKHKNLTTKEIKLCWVGYLFGGLLMITPIITGKVLFNYLSPESFCEFRDRTLNPSCIFEVKLNQHRSGEK